MRVYLQVHIDTDKKNGVQARMEVDCINSARDAVNVGDIAALTRMFRTRLTNELKFSPSDGVIAPISKIPETPETPVYGDGR